MMKNQLIGIFLMLIETAMAQPEVLNIYPSDKTPLAISCSSKEKIDSTDEGRPRFIHHVTEPQIFFYKTRKTNPNHPALLVLPGGGYGIISIENEGRKVAERFNSEGFDVYVLKYRTPTASCQIERQWAPLTDAMTALELIRKRGHETVGLIGFSAGGHLGATLGTLFDKNPHHSPINPPDFSCLVYPVISMDHFPHLGSRSKLLPDTHSKWVNVFSAEKNITSKSPPTLLIHATDDVAVSYQHSSLFFEAMMKKKIHAEIHLFPYGGHAFGIGKKYKPESPEWIPLALDFFQQFQKK